MRPFANPRSSPRRTFTASASMATLGGAEYVVDQDDRRKEPEARREAHGHRGEKGHHHHGLREQDPHPPPSQAVARQDVQERTEGPFDGPRNVERADEGSDRRRLEPLAAHLGRDGGRGESRRDSLGEIEEEERGQSAAAGSQQIRKSHGGEGAFRPARCQGGHARPGGAFAELALLDQMPDPPRLLWRYGGLSLSPFVPGCNEGGGAGSFYDPRNNRATRLAGFLIQVP